MEHPADALPHRAWGRSEIHDASPRHADGKKRNAALLPEGLPGPARGGNFSGFAVIVREGGQRTKYLFGSPADCLFERAAHPRAGGGRRHSAAAASATARRPDGG